jgi:ABC-2 type transport system ATP-binding protein
MNPAIETENLGKNYGNVKAVDHLSLRVVEGEIYAFLGLNGAGKTTTIRMLLGMIKPTYGQATVLQTRVRLGSRKPWESIGYMVETPHSYPELSVYENLEVARRLHPGTPRKAINDIIERMGLAAYADKRTRNLSHGNSQRLGLAKALLHHPKLLILDEPANGLDPAGIVEIRELLLELTRQQGVTVFMSSHILAEVARLARRIGIIHNGQVIQELSTDALEKNRHKRVLIQNRDNEAALHTLTGADQTARIVEKGMLELKSEFSVAHPEEINCLLVQAGIPPTLLMVEEEELEQYFLRLVGLNGGSQHE